jgi:hypothetical protein
MGISVRGAARHALGQTGPISVRQVFLHGATTASLRLVLTNLVRREISFAVSECVFGWTAQYQQSWSDVVVRIRLNPDPGISEATMVDLRATWETTIQDRWSNRWAIGQPGESAIPIRFDVQWVTGSEHHVVRVRPGSGRSNMGLWYTEDTGDVAAHEFGHMIGNPDEYAEPERCPDRSPVDTGTIMDNLSNNIPARLLTRLAANVGSGIVAVLFDLQTGRLADPSF